MNTTVARTTNGNSGIPPVEVGVEVAVEELDTVVEGVVMLEEVLELEEEVEPMEVLELVEEVVVRTVDVVVVEVEAEVVVPADVVDEVEVEEVVVLVVALLDQENFAVANITGPYPPQVAFTT